MPVDQCAVCKKPGEKKCPSCKVIYYCSSEHQKQHLEEHKKDCFCYEVKFRRLIKVYIYLIILNERFLPPMIWANI